MMKAEQQMEQIIKEKNREPFYNYYLRLGYEHKTAACLALFTYGEYRFKAFSMDHLYDALLKGEEYLPPEVQEARKQSRRQRLFGRFARAFSSSNGSAPQGAPSVARTMRLSVKSAPSMQSEAAASFGQSMAPQLSPTLSYNAADAEQSSIESDDFAEEKLCYAAPGSPMGMSPDPLLFAGALGYATDEYEQIEEKDARNTATESTSTFRMTTNTASAGVILNQLRNGRRIDRSMVRIEEMLNYFRYESEVPGNEMFHLSYEVMDSEDNKKYLYIHVQGREEVKDQQNIIILLDVSGSMSGNAEQTQAIIATIVSKLGNGDKLEFIFRPLRAE